MTDIRKRASLTKNVELVSIKLRGAIGWLLKSKKLKEYLATFGEVLDKFTPENKYPTKQKLKKVQRQLRLLSENKIMVHSETEETDKHP